MARQSDIPTKVRNESGYTESQKSRTDLPTNPSGLTDRLPALHPDPMDSPEISVRVGGRKVLTLEQLAARYDMTVPAVERMLSRAGLKGVKVGRVYDPAATDAAKNSRPGYGAPGVPKPHRPPVAE
jgi:hypothetical protein